MIYIPSTLFEPLLSKLPKPQRCYSKILSMSAQPSFSRSAIDGRPSSVCLCLWYKQHRPLGSCGVCDALGVTRLRLATPLIYHIRYSFLGVYLSHTHIYLSIYIYISIYLYIYIYIYIYTYISIYIYIHIYVYTYINMYT